MFIWKILNNGLLTNDERKRRGLAESAICPLCNSGDETIDHLFRQCDQVKDIWGLAESPSDFSSSSHFPMTSWIKKACSNTKMTGKGITWQTMFPYMLWHIWLARNNIIFNNVHTPAGEVVRRVTDDTNEALHLLLRHNGPLTATQQWVAWLPPPHGMVKLNTDGAMKSSSRLASAGGLFRNHQGNWVLGFISNIGHTSSFMAELWGVREGLRIAKIHGFDKIILEADSEAMIQALENDSAPTSHVNTLVKECKHIMKQFHTIKLCHIFREGNQCADFLANQGQQAVWGTSILDHPPDDMRDLLLRDSQCVATCRRH